MRTLTILIQLVLGRLPGLTRIRLFGGEYFLMRPIGGAEGEGEGEATGDGEGEGAGSGDGEGEGEGDEGLKDEAAREVLRKERRKAEAKEKEAKEALKRAEKAEKALKEREDADKDELTRAQDRVAELEGEKAKTTETLQRARLIAELSKSKYELADAEVSAKLIEDIEFDEDGQPQGVEEAVTDLLERVPGLKAQAPAGGGGSPANGNRGGKSMKTEELRELARTNPAKFAEMLEKGEVPQEALTGAK